MPNPPYPTPTAEPPEGYVELWDYNLAGYTLPDDYPEALSTLHETQALALWPTDPIERYYAQRPIYTFGYQLRDYVLTEDKVFFLTDWWNFFQKPDQEHSRRGLIDLFTDCKQYHDEIMAQFPDHVSEYAAAQWYYACDETEYDPLPLCISIAGSIDRSTMAASGTGQGRHATQWRIMDIFSNTEVANGSTTPNPDINNITWSFIAQYDIQYQLQFGDGAGYWTSTNGLFGFSSSGGGGGGEDDLVVGGAAVSGGENELFGWHNEASGWRLYYRNADLLKYINMTVG